MSNVVHYSIAGEQGVATQPVVDALLRRADYRLALEMWTIAPPQRAPQWFLEVCQTLHAFFQAVFALEPGEHRERLMREAADETATLTKLRPFVGREIGRA